MVCIALSTPLSLYCTPTFAMGISTQEYIGNDYTNLLYFLLITLFIVINNSYIPRSGSAVNYRSLILFTTVPLFI